MLSFRYILLSGTSLTPVGPTPTLNLNFTTMTALPSTITFSRPSNATYYDSTGKLTYAPNNLVTYSNTFTNAAWSASGASVALAPSITDPFGGTSSWKLTEGTTSGGHRINTGVTSPLGRYMFSFYAKSAERTQASIDMSDSTAGGPSYVVNLTDGSIASSGFDGGGSWTDSGVNVTNVGNGWFRIAVYGGRTLGTDIGPIIATGFNNNYSYTGDGTSGIYIYGAQLEAVTYQTTPGTYNATTSAAYYGARLDYNPATLAARGLLIEEARTNAQTYSQDFDNAAWTKGNTTVTANTITSPDGTINAETLTAAATGSAPHNIYMFTVPAANFALSVFAKKGTSRYVFLVRGQSGNGYASAVFDLDGSGSGATQTSVAVGNTISSTQQENIGNGWFRLTLVSSGAGSGFLGFGFAGAATGNAFDAFGGVTFATSGTETFYIWGAQAEAASFATSYIPTAGGTVSRSADTASMTGTNFSSWYNQSEGTFVPQYDVEGFATNPGVFRASNSGATNYSQTRLTSTTSVGDVVVSTSQASFSFGGAIINALQKFALAYRVNDFAGTLNGATPLTDTSGSAPTDLDRVFLADVGSNVAPLNGHLASFVYYPSRLSDGQLQQLTLSAPPVGNALVWGDGNYLVWGDGNFLTWG